jgi:uncharacterized protein (DUF2267 family)
MAKGVSVFDETVQLTHVWLKELMEDLEWTDRHRAYLALRATLHALRDRLSVEQAAKLGAQLPMLVRGFYYEGWHPAHKPLKDKSLDGFLAAIWGELNPNTMAGSADPAEVARAVVGLLVRHVSEGEIAHVRQSLSKPIRELWPPAYVVSPEIVPL